MPKTLSVVEKGEQREGEEVYTIVVTRSGVDKARELTRTEVRAKRDRENLRTEILQGQLKAAALDGTAMDALMQNLDKSNKKAAEFRGIIAFLDSGD